jgi:hypothetical protein
MISSEKIKNILEELGYKLFDKGSYWQSSAVYRNGDNKTALQIYKDTGAWKDYVQNTPFMPFKQLLVLTLNTNDPKELKKYLNKEETFFLTEQARSNIETIQSEEIYASSLLDNLFPHYKFYNNRGISDDTLQLLKGGLATKGQMYQRFVFPIYNEYKQIHGFSGRDMSSNSNRPKWKHMGKKKSWVYPAYVPTSSGILFDEVDKDYVLLVESIGDALSCIEHGITNVLVSFGLDLSSKLICSLMKFNFKKVILSFNNDNNKEDNRGMNACVKNYLKLLSYYDSSSIKICLPVKNDFGDMSQEDFDKWKEKLTIINSLDQIPKIVSHAKKLDKTQKIPKNLRNNLKILYEEA